MTGATARRALPFGLLPVSAALALLAAPAAAYVPYTTSGGTPLHWLGDTIHYAVADDLPAPLTRTGVQRVAADAFAAWVTLACHPLDAVFDGFSAGLPLDQADRQNVVVWIHDVATWRASYGALELARTAVTHRTQSGEIVDADVVVNAGGFAFSEALACTPEVYDLQSTLTHEFGHFFGLDHAPLETATMAPTTDPGICTKRTLDPDDEAGYCATYLPYTPVEPSPEVGADAASADTLSAAEPEPRPPVQREEGCTGSGGLPPLGLALLAALRGARRSTRRRRPGRAAARAR